MRTVNSVILLGNVVKDPELKMTMSGKEFATFILATNRELPKGSLQTSSSEFHSIVAWGPLARIASSFCVKGKLVYLEGYLKTRSWEGDGGKKLYRTEVITTNIIALSAADERASHSEIAELKPENDFFSATEDDFFADNN